MQSAIILWFKNDLRLHDHEALDYAVSRSTKVIPLYIFDDRQFKTTQYFNLPKTNAFRAQFLIESVQNLKERLIGKGSDLIIKKGIPEDIIPELCKQYLVREVVYHNEATPEESDIQDELNKRLLKIGVETTSFWSNTLIHHDDLPFPLAKIPVVFTKYRTQIERDCSVRDLFQEPHFIPSPEFQYLGNIPSLKELGLELPHESNKAVLRFKGGETEALQRVDDYIWKDDLLKDYETTRNGMLGADYSSKFSAWLSVGCISAKYIYHEVQLYELQRVKNKSTYWLIFELFWRDFFRFTATKYFKQFFSERGVNKKIDCDWKVDFEMFEKWKNAKTGFPFIDANMRELMETGYMSNRGRQNVASFLIKDLKVNWLMGAEYFESMLIDYDVCSNYGNWAYIAGVGADPRENRYFNIFTQADRYDHDSLYMKHWLPELAHLQSKAIHQVHEFTVQERKQNDITMYPLPIINFRNSPQKEIVFT
jgi:deoxyribodipyrimidine photo-lyase